MSRSARLTTSMVHEYEGVKVALLTQHGKELAVGPPLAAAFRAKVVRVTGFDTDLLGTFTRETPRPGTALQAARAKARVGLALSGLDFAIGSEGQFGPDPLGFSSWDEELLVFLDARRGLEVTARASGPARRTHGEVQTLPELLALARVAGFPSHGLVLRPDGPDGAPVTKAVTGEAQLRAEFARARRASRAGVVFAESELRAHLNPTRMGVIARAAEALVARLSVPCPGCGSPGFGLVEQVSGLPCRSCRAPTRAPRAERHGCPACAYTHVREVPGFAEPRHCDACNP
ncbi:MAG: hypothetical protein JNK82_28210 [Myxococcaceae bacterium]|nr:hypothetical protein [Myxococcaceae bacterium]